MTTSSSQLVARYDREARVYAELWAPVLHVASLKLLPHLVDGSVRHVLDVGAGVGTMLDDLATAFPGARVFGVDRSRGMLSLAPKHDGHAAMDAGRLAIRGESLDRVFMLFMLFRLDSPGDGLREARRVLRPGGLVGAITWATELASAATEVWVECLDSHGAAPADPSTVTRRDRVDSSEKIETLLQQAGLVDRRCWVDELTSRIDAEQLIRLRTSMGYLKPRFDSLVPTVQAACLAEARVRMSGMPPEAFIARAQLVYSIARA